MRPRSLPEVAFSTGLRYAAMCARTDAAYGESTLVHSIGVIGVSSSEVAVEAVLRCVKSLCLIKPQMFISTEIIRGPGPGLGVLFLTSAFTSQELIRL